MGSPLFHIIFCFLALSFWIKTTEAQGGSLVPGSCRVCAADCQRFPRQDGGCAACVCDGTVLSECSPVTCPLFCSIDLSDDGCRMCNCNRSNVICPPLRPCPAECQSNKDDNGCPICQCPDNVNTNDPFDPTSPTCPPVPVCPLGCINQVTFREQIECFECNCTLVPQMPGFNNPFGPNMNRPGQQQQNPFLQNVGGRPGQMLMNQMQLQCGETQCDPDCRLCVGRDGCGRCLCGNNANVCPAVPACRRSCITRGNSGCLTCSCPGGATGIGGFGGLLNGRPRPGSNPFFNPFRILSSRDPDDGPLTLIFTKTDSDGSDLDFDDSPPFVDIPLEQIDPNINSGFDPNIQSMIGNRPVIDVISEPGSPFGVDISNTNPNFIPNRDLNNPNLPYEDPSYIDEGLTNPLDQIPDNQQSTPNSPSIPSPQNPNVSTNEIIPNVGPNTNSGNNNNGNNNQNSNPGSDTNDPGNNGNNNNNDNFDNNNGNNNDGNTGTSNGANNAPDIPLTPNNVNDQQPMNENQPDMNGAPNNIPDPTNTQENDIQANRPLPDQNEPVPGAPDVEILADPSSLFERQQKYPGKDQVSKSLDQLDLKDELVQKLLQTLMRQAF